MTGNSGIHSTTPILSVKDLRVDYVQQGQVTHAVNGMSFEICPGECVGFVGPNGAGKSTTIKVLMGFLFPTSGEVQVFGEKAGTVASRQRMGYLPEVSLYYPFMKARELLELYGGLHGLSRRQLAERIPPLLEEVGLPGKGEVILRHFSKGMQQRLGIAQAIISDPELLVFDELSSGLDPIGRHDLRAVLNRLKRAGKTIFFSSHELTEVEDLCDRVLIVHKGRIIEAKAVGELLTPLNRFTVIFELQGKDPPLLPDDPDVDCQRNGDTYRLNVVGSEKYANLLKVLASSGAVIQQAHAEQVSLEKYFMSLIRSIEAPAGS